MTTYKLMYICMYVAPNTPLVLKKQILVTVEVDSFFFKNCFTVNSCSSIFIECLLSEVLFCIRHFIVRLLVLKSTWTEFKLIWHDKFLSHGCLVTGAFEEDVFCLALNGTLKGGLNIIPWQPNIGFWKRFYMAWTF